MTAESRPPSLIDRFNRSHAARLQSATLERLWRTAYGEDYPAEAQPNAFFSRTTLQRLAGALHVRPGHTVVDLGCGHGGPGLWVAQQVGANLIGIDLSAVGVALARDRAAALGSGEARFQEGDLTATGLTEASCDAVMSLDVLLFVPDKAAAAREVARILRPGGRFGFTTWEQPGYSERLGAPQLADHRPLLAAAGFDVEIYEEPPNWQRQQRALLEGIIASESKLAEEMEATVAASYVAMARGSLADMPVRRYVFVVARRRLA
jgi:ubiquinone/menaquinone biosynthesis C-methylase UbiE